MKKLIFLLCILNSNLFAQQTNYPFFDLPDYYCDYEGPLYLYDYTPSFNTSTGSFGGIGVVGAFFTPPPGPGPTTILITYYDNAGIPLYDDYITILYDCCHSIPPDVTIDLPEKYCVSESLLDLTNYVSQQGGTFFGNSVTGNFFDPSVLITPFPDPVYTITYQWYNSVQMCYNYVHDLFYVDFDCCDYDPGSPFVVPSFGGTATGLGLTNFTGTDVTILGDFYLDDNFLIDNSLVRLDEDVTITVKTGKTLTITNNSDLFSCQQVVWDGIKLEPGANIVVNGNSIIQDAETAINAIDDATVKLEDCTFNKNVVGVYVAYTGSQITSYPININGNVRFTCASSTNSPGGTLDDNISNNSIGFRGITAIRTNQLAVGNISSSANYFDNLEYGIYAEETELRIYNNQFSNIRGTESDNIFTGELFYYAIYALNSKTSRMALIGNLSFGDFTNGNNLFIDCVNGIYLENYEKTSIVNNYFDAPIITPPSQRNGETAVITANDFVTPFFNMTINDNTIKEIASGIKTQFLLNNVFTNNFLSIRNNNISRSSSRALTQGISLTSVIPSNLNGFGNNWNISDNKIINCRNGIKVSGIRAADLIIDNNEIEMTGGAPLLTVRYGILLENSYRTNIINNLVKGANGFALNTLNKGIKVAFSNTTLVSCNDIRKMGQSLVFEGTSYGTITGNKIQRAYDGFVLLNNGTIGQQGDANNPIDNKWVGPFFNSHTLTQNTSTANTDSPLYLRTYGIFLPTDNEFLNGTPTDVYTLNFGLQSASGQMIQCPALPLGVKVREDLAKGHQNYSDFELSTKWINKHTVYSELQLDSTLVQQSSILDSFYLASQNTCFDEVNKIINAATQLDTVLLGTLTGNFVPVCNIEQNYEDFYSIMFNYWVSDSVSSSEITTLENIAWQCPIIGGTVVYSARTFYDFLNNTTTDFEDNCDLESRIKEFSADDETATEILIYPNPNSGEFTIELKNQDSGKICIFDMTGKAIFNETISSSRISIRLTDISPGVYIIEFKNDNIVSRTKFIVR